MAREDDGDETYIVARLRGRVHDAKMDHEQMMDDAATEIERLRRALERIRDECDPYATMAPFIARDALENKQDD